MRSRRHRRDTSTYRELANYKERVQSFNAAAMKLPEYVRVQLELDTGDSRTRNDVISARIRTLERCIERIRRLH